jgi:hypothetical protein
MDARKASSLSLRNTYAFRQQVIATARNGIGACRSRLRRSSRRNGWSGLPSTAGARSRWGFGLHPWKEIRPDTGRFYAQSVVSGGARAHR